MRNLVHNVGSSTPRRTGLPGNDGWRWENLWRCAPQTAGQQNEWKKPGKTVTATAERV